MSESEQAFWLIGLVVALGACLVWAIHEIENWRRRQREQAALIRDAMRFVATAEKDRNG